MKLWIWLGLAALTAPSVSVAPADVRMVEVTGEGAKYWSRWRGPSGQGQVPAGQYTDRWSPTAGVQWKVAIPGSGNSSPIVWGDRIFLTTARDRGQRLSMLAYSRKDGAKLWETDIPQNGVEYPHEKNGYASATATTDGELVYASFRRHGLVAFDFTGKIVWHRKFGIIDNYHGPAGSPVLCQDRVFIYQDANPAPGQRAFVGAFDKKTGKTMWETPRRETVGWGMAVVFASSGRAGPTMAIRPGGSGDVTATHVAWNSPKGSPFVPSGIVVGDLLYLINDMQSILTVYEAATGTLVYQNRLGVAQREGFSGRPSSLRRAARSSCCT